MKTTARTPANRNLLFAVALIAGSLLSHAQSMKSAGNGLQLMDRQKEIALALSACPAFVANEAAVYVLEASGYVKVRESKNGFTAIVQHSLPTSQEPQCLDAEGTRTHLPRILKVAEMREQGKSADEIRVFVAEAFANGIFQPPIRPGIVYMLSPENLVPSEKGVMIHFPPHVMFYAPYLKNADIGSKGQGGGGPAFVVNEGSPHAVVIVPVGEHQGMSHAPNEAQ